MTVLIRPPDFPFDIAQGNYIQRIAYDASGNAIYQGWAQPGAATSAAAWRIVQNTYDGSNRYTSNGFPQISGTLSVAFSFVWDNRASYIYS